MKKAPVVILAVLLALAVILMVYFFIQNKDAKVELEALIGQKNNSVQQLTQSLDTWESKYKILETNYEKSIAELNLTNSQFAEMQKKNASAISALTQEAKEKQQILQDQLIERERQLQERQNNVQDLEASVGVSEKKLQTVSDQYRQAQEDIERLKSENSQLNQTIAGLADKLSNMEEQISTEQNKLKNQEEHIKQVKVTYENLLTELDDEITKKEAALQQIEKGLRITFVDEILFNFGKTKISAEGQQKLLKVANTLSKINNKKIRIQGHTDDIPIAMEYRYKYPSNWELSAARAAAVVRFFIEQGDIKGENMEAVGHAYYQPIATNKTPEGRLANRRVEILITP